jgi:hypothetical protein
MSPTKNFLMKTFSQTSPQIFLTSLVVVCASSLCSTAFALERQVSVTGSCTHQVTTDRGSITVTADVRDDSLKSAIKKATHQYERVLDAVKKLKLENADLHTVEYNVGEVREWEKNKTVFKGYRARIGLSVSTSDIQRLGEVMDIAAREEIRDIGSLNTFLSDEKILKEQDLCLKEAAEHAKSKAEKLANTLGASLGPVVTLLESNVTTPPRLIPMPMMKAMAEAQAVSAPAPVEGGKQEVTATVNVSFELK